MSGAPGYGSVDYALGTGAVNEPVRDLECSAVGADVFSNAEHARIALHLFPDSLADGFEVSHGWHWMSLAKAAEPVVIARAPCFFLSLTIHR